MNWIQNDELFFKELATGNKWAMYVSDFLNSKNIKCHAPESKIRKNLQEIEEFSKTEKDIVFDLMSGHIEVKSRNLSFGSSNFDYPYETAFVDTLNGWNKKEEKPLAVILVSQRTSQMLVIPVSTENTWKSVSKYDHVRGIYETWLTVDKSLLRPIDELIGWLESRQSNNYLKSINI